jgi:Kdo2-lipid IVA lauroyltransferase/acyltransferase
VTSLLRLISFFVGLLPASLMRSLARLLSFFVFSVFRYRRDVIAHNLARAFPDKTDAERVILQSEACLHLALCLLEFFKMPSYAKRNYEGVFRVEGMEHYEKAKAQGKGLLVLTGHLGSFELGAGAMAQRLEENACLIVKSFPEAVERFVTGVREASSLSVFTAKGGMKNALRALKNKDLVVFVQDQNSTRHIGVFVDFFGHEACTMSGLAVIALRTEAPVLGVSIWREEDGGHVLAFHPEIPLERKENKDESLVHMTQVYTRFIEDRIREHPAQWLWTHRRWKTQR